MRLVVGGETYFVRFAHSEEKRGRITDCRIEHDGVLMGEGSARCSLLDQFSKREGRVLAMTRALAELRSSKEFRRQLWSAYFAISKKPRG